MAQQRSRASKAPHTARAATRVLDILELLAAKPSGLTLSEVAAELAVPISSLHSLMHGLEARRYLVRGRDRRRYCLGPQLPEVSRAYLDPEEPFTGARRAMRLVADRSGETVDMAVLSGQNVEYVDGVASRYPLSAQSLAGQRLPAHAVAAGKALLATLSDEQLAELYADFPWPPSAAWTPPAHSLEALQQDIEEVRWTGYAYDSGGAGVGLSSLATVLPEHTGRPAVALSISVPSARLLENELWNLVETLREVASSAIGRGYPRKKRPLIGWSMSFTRNPVFVAMRRAASEAVVHTGAHILWMDAPNEVKQAADVRRLLEEPLDALIIQPADALNAVPFFAEARQRDLLLICFHRSVRSRAFDFFAGSDVYHRGCLQAHAVARLLGGQGGVFVVEGGAYDDNARSIGQGNRDTLRQYPGIQLLGSHACEHWLPETARDTIREALAAFGADRLNGIIAANDFMAYAIADLLASYGLTNRIVLVGGDGDDRAIELIRSGALAGTVLQDSAGMAVATLEYALRVLNGSASIADLPQRSLFHAPEGPLVSALDVPDIWVDKTNISVLEAYWARRHATPLLTPHA